MILVTVVIGVIGGCDVDFGTNNNGNNGGGGGGGSTSESVEGTIVDVVPSRSSGVSNITAQISLQSAVRMYMDTTSDTGFFKVEGSFSGNPQLDFLDEDNDQSSLGTIILNVFPRATLKLGNIRLDTGNVVFENDIKVIFNADLTQNNCVDNSGSIKVEPTDGSNLDIIVQITNSTDLERDNDSITCNDLLIGQTLKITGVLLVGNSVEADSIDVQ